MMKAICKYAGEENDGSALVVEAGLNVISPCEDAGQVLWYKSTCMRYVIVNKASASDTADAIVVLELWTCMCSHAREGTDQRLAVNLCEALSPIQPVMQPYPMPLAYAFDLLVFLLAIFSNASSGGSSGDWALFLPFFLGAAPYFSAKLSKKFSLLPLLRC
jgi:hypothetical protein